MRTLAGLCKRVNILPVAVAAILSSAQSIAQTAQTHIWPNGTFLTDDGPFLPTTIQGNLGSCSAGATGYGILGPNNCATGQPIPLETTCFTPVNIPLGAALASISVPYVSSDSNISTLRLALYGSANDGSGPGALVDDLGLANRSIQLRQPPVAGTVFAKFANGYHNSGAAGIHWLAVMNGPTGTNSLFYTGYPYSTNGGILNITAAPYVESVYGSGLNSFQTSGHSFCSNVIGYGEFPLTAPPSDGMEHMPFTYLFGLTNQ
jgi:hypothetical protein